MLWCFSAGAEPNGGAKWNFKLAPYAWLAGQKGKVGTLPPLPPTDIDVDFYDDILGNITGALMLVGEARKGRFGMVADVVYTDIEGEKPTPGPFFSTITARTKSWTVSVQSESTYNWKTEKWAVPINVAVSKREFAGRGRVQG